MMRCYRNPVEEGPDRRKPMDLTLTEGPIPCPSFSRYLGDPRKDHISNGIVFCLVARSTQKCDHLRHIPCLRKKGCLYRGSRNPSIPFLMHIRYTAFIRRTSARQGKAQVAGNRAELYRVRHLLGYLCFGDSLLTVALIHIVGFSKSHNCKHSPDASHILLPSLSLAQFPQHFPPNVGIRGDGGLCMYLARNGAFRNNPLLYTFNLASLAESAVPTFRFRFRGLALANLILPAQAAS